MGDIRIYNKDFKLISIIPKFIASNWELKFSGYGCGEIEFERSDDIVSVLYENEYLFLVQDGIQSIVTGYKIGKTCIVFTRTLEWLLTKFVVKEVTCGKNLSETAENILSALPEDFGLKFCGIDDERDMSDYSFNEAKDIYTAVIEAINDDKIGFSFTADFSDGTFTFSLISAKENEEFILCDEYRTSYDSEYTHHIQDKADGGCFYHEVTYMGRWNPETNQPPLSIRPENYGKYYKISEDGSAFGMNLYKDDVILCRDKSGKFTKVEEAKPYLVEIPAENDGVFSWNEMISAKCENEANKILKTRKATDLLTAKTTLSYGKDYKIGDILKTKFFGKNTSFSVKKLVSEVHLWTERGSSGASPFMKDIKEDGNVI